MRAVVPQESLVSSAAPLSATSPTTATQPSIAATISAVPPCRLLEHHHSVWQMQIRCSYLRLFHLRSTSRPWSRRAVTRLAWPLAAAQCSAV